MRIVFIIPGATGGGVRSVMRIATGLSNRGHSVRVLFKRPSRGWRDQLRSLYLRVRFDRREHWLHDAECACEPFDRITPDIVGENDAVVAVGVACTLAIADFPHRCGIGVQNCRGVEPWVNQKMERAWELPMPRIVVASHLERLMREAGSRDPIYVVHNGVDTSAYFASPAAGERRAVGTVYHGGSVKDPELLLDVLRGLSISNPGVPLNAFGVFPRPARLPPSAKYVRFPSQSDARDLYSESLIWFVGSRNEGLANPVLEAAACGCAVVSTDCGGSADIIQHERNGLITPVGDRDAMIAAVQRLLADTTLRERLAAEGTRTVREYTWPRAVQRFESALQDIVDNARERKFAAKSCLEPISATV